jgi:hypothetical protein
VVGGVVGFVTTPKDGTSNLGHAALFSGVTAATCGVAGLFIFDEEKRANELERQNGVMKKELGAFNAGGSPAPELTAEVSANSGKDLPKEVLGLVKQGKWQLYKLNRWRPMGENVLVHEDKMFKLTLPHLNPGTINDSE